MTSMGRKQHALSGGPMVPGNGQEVRIIEKGQVAGAA
jgi:hypothetical protein